MRFLRKGINRWEAIRRILLPVATQLQFTIIFPLALLVVVSYPFLNSLHHESKSHILLHETHLELNCSVLHIRQAVFVPPVFVSATDPALFALLEPLRLLTDQLALDPSGPQLYSVFNEKTPPVSMYVAPKSHNPQGLLFSYIYYNEPEAEIWDNTLRQISWGPLPPPVSNFVDRQELQEAQLSTASSAHFSFWPGNNLLTQVILWMVVILFILYAMACLYSSHVYRPNLLVGIIVVRILIGGVASTSIISIVFPAFDTLIFTRFAWVMLIPLFLGVMNAIRVVMAAETDPSSAPTSFNRLLRAYCYSFSWLDSVFVPVFLILFCLFCGFFSQQSLIPLTAFVAVWIIVDTFIHYTLFAATLYIDMVGLEFHDFLTLEQPAVPTARFDFLTKLKNSSIWCFLQAVAYNLKIASILPVLTAIVLHCNGYYLLNKVHPHIKNTLNKPEYIDIFMDPLSDLLQDYSLLEVFAPAIFEVNGYFDRPTAKLSFAFSTLRYGNISSLLLETFCLLIFVSSVCMIAIILLTDRHHLNINIKGHLFKDERFAECTIDIGSDLDIVKLATDNSCIASLTLSGDLNVTDASSMISSPQTILSVSNIKNPWAVQHVVLNSYKSMAGIICAKSIHMWSLRTNQKIYDFYFDNLKEVTPKNVFWADSTLNVLTAEGRVLEVYTDRAPRVVKIHDSRIAWIRTSHSCTEFHVSLFCDEHNELYICKRTSLAWETFPLRLAEAYLASQCSAETPREIPSVMGMLRGPIPWTVPFTGTDKFIDSIAIPDIKTDLIISDKRAMFLDTHSGVIIRYITLDNFKPGTIKVFHSQPTHCAFCGAIAISSLSIAYELADIPGALVCETYRVENRSRSNICLRLERDPTETRCHGFVAAKSTRSMVRDVERWEPIDINMIVGIKRGQDRHAAFPVHNTEREGFSLSSSGNKSLFRITEQAQHGHLLTGALGPARPLGPKSICVGFGNTIKVLYHQNQC